MRAARLLPVVLLAGLTACGSGDADRGAAARVQVDTLPGGAVRTVSEAPVDSGAWRLTLAHRIQPAADDSGELMQPRDLVLTDDGTLLVSEESDAHVKVFNAAGQYVRRIGRNGEGPGEFRVAFLAARGDTLLVQDPMTGRASTFRISDGAFLQSRPTTCCYWSPLDVDGQARAVLPANHSPSDSTLGPAMAYIRAAFGENSADTVFVWRRRSATAPYWEIGDGRTMQMRMPVPYAPRNVEAVDRRGGWITAWTGEYLLRATSNGSDTTALFGRPYTPPRVSSADKDRLVDARIADMTAANTGLPEAALRAGMPASRSPDERPAFEQFRTDGAGRTWVRRLTDDSTSHVEYDLFDADRRWLDVIRIPRAGWPAQAFAPMAWSADRVAVAVEDDEGRPAVLVYTIERVAP